jgi:heme/copper-type cytochrome/quinol oxidase subunit 3
MSAPAHDERQIDGRNLVVGTWVFVAADAFLFAGCFFAYVYLRSLNENHMWNPPGQDPSLALGVLSVALVLASAATWAVAAGRIRAGGLGFGAAATATLALIGAACVVQGWQLFDPGFSPSHAGGFGSVFIVTTAIFLVHLLAALYWLRSIAADARDPADAAMAPARRAAFSSFWGFFTGVFVLFFVLFYLVS